MKYPQTVIFLDKVIPASDAAALQKSLPVEGSTDKRWIRAADVYGFGEYLSTPKLLFNGPFTLVKSEVRCPSCGEMTPIVAIEASGFVPCQGEKHDLALNMAFFLEGGVDKLEKRPVFLTHVQDYPADFLKLARKHSFRFRKYEFEDDVYYANGCERCGGAIDDFRIFYEHDGPLARCNPCPTRSDIALDFRMPIVADAQFA